MVFALALFWYQRDKSDEARQEQLLISMVAEARACSDLLDERPAELRGLNGRALGTAVLEPLPMTVLNEVIRSGVNHPSDTFGLVLISGHINAHNTNVGTLAAMEGSKVEPQALQGAIKRLKWRQKIVADYCRHSIERSVGTPGGYPARRPDTSSLVHRLTSSRSQC